MARSTTLALSGTTGLEVWAVSIARLLSMSSSFCCPKSLSPLAPACPPKLDSEPAPANDDSCVVRTLAAAVPDSKRFNAPPGVVSPSPSISLSPDRAPQSATDTVRALIRDKRFLERVKDVECRRLLEGLGRGVEGVKALPGAQGGLTP